MEPPKTISLLLHEIVFGSFLLSMGIRVSLARGLGTGDALLYVALLGISGLLVCLTRTVASEWTWRLRLGYYPLAMNIVYLHLGRVIPLIHPTLEDAWLQRMDAWLIGANLSVRLQAIIQPILTEFFSFSYLLFLPYLTLSMLWYLAGELRLLKKFYSGLFTLYGLGFLGYTLVPALGPYLAMSSQFNVPLNGWWFTQWNAQVVGHYSNRVDVFPSLHCAVSSYLLFFDLLHKKWRFRFYALPCVGLWISTLYLRYHYFVDLVVGFPLGAFCLWLVERGWGKDEIACRT